VIGNFGLPLFVYLVWKFISQIVDSKRLSPKIPLLASGLLIVFITKALGSQETLSRKGFLPPEAIKIMNGGKK